MNRCPVCFSNENSFVLYIDRIWKKKYKVLSCSLCHLFYLPDKPLLKEVIAFYQGDYYKFSPFKEYLKNLFRYFRSVSQFEYINSVVKAKKLSILEIGSCDGMLISMFKKDNKVMGTEFATKYIKLGRQKYKIKLINKNFEDLKETYDLIIMSHVFEHFLDINVSIQYLTRLLKQNGFIFIEVPNSPYFEGKVNTELDEFLQTTHIYNFSLNNIRMFFENNNFKIIDLSRFYYNLPNQRQDANKKLARILMMGKGLTFNDLFSVVLYLFKAILKPSLSYNKIEASKTKWLGQGDNIRLIVQKK